MQDLHIMIIYLFGYIPYIAYLLARYQPVGTIFFVVSAMSYQKYQIIIKEGCSKEVHCSLLGWNNRSRDAALLKVLGQGLYNQPLLITSLFVFRLLIDNDGRLRTSSVMQVNSSLPCSGRLKHTGSERSVFALNLIHVGKSLLGREKVEYRAAILNFHEQSLIVGPSFLHALQLLDILYMPS